MLYHLSWFKKLHHGIVMHTNCLRIFSSLFGSLV
ncbi:hypothetical protein CIPAW_15G043200 [Carya illinoinensis]|uniref:Uncharacterized protein n=1 Tax=Carya illinoinensis TaxID=32201 RepID=A0A8T1NBB7_CARIL|nr:hypothetical protein CIPAW_15G043200 [Carya illinoinensis]